MANERMSELQPYPPSGREAGHAALFYEDLVQLPARACFGQIAGSLIVSAGHVYGNPEKPLYVINDARDALPRYCVLIDHPVQNIGQVPFAVLRRLICAPNHPTPGMALVAGLGEIAALSHTVGNTHFSEAFTTAAAWDEAARLQAVYDGVFGPESPLIPTWPVIPPPQT